MPGRKLPHAGSLRGFRRCRAGPTRMSPAVHGIEGHARTLRAWHLAVLRYAVTLDYADRLAVLRIAHEIDRFELRQDGKADFDFFRPDQRGALRRNPATERTRRCDPATIPRTDRRRPPATGACDSGRHRPVEG